MEDTKKCKGCLKTKDVEDFPPNRNYCKACVKKKREEGKAEKVKEVKPKPEKKSPSKIEETIETKKAKLNTSFKRCLSEITDGSDHKMAILEMIHLLTLFDMQLDKIYADS